MVNYLLILFTLISSFWSFAQPGSAPVIVENGKKFYEHTIVAGQTLWGIQQMYNVKAEEVMAVNPGLTEGLKVGQKIKIPFPAEEVKLRSYTVEKGETLYGIAKKFNTSPENVIALNPELQEGLKAGQEIKVPDNGSVQIQDNKVEIKQEEVKEEVPNPFVNEEKADTVNRLNLNDSIVSHTVRAGETMYSISKRFMVSLEEIRAANNLSSSTVKEGQVLVIPLKHENAISPAIKQVPEEQVVTGETPKAMVKKDRYKVAVLLPFYLDYGAGYSDYVSAAATQFYMGVELAVDSLRSMGFKADVHVYDTRNDTNSVKKMLDEKKLAQMDMIIGPFFEGNQRVVADFCLKHKIRMVCPVSAPTALLKDNPYVYSSVPSNITLIKGEATYILKYHGKDNIVVVRPTKDSDKPLYEAFVKEFNSHPVNGSRPVLAETNLDQLGMYVKKGVNTVFVVPTEDKNFAMKFMNNLNQAAFKINDNSVYVFGTKEWMNFTDVNNVYKNKYNFHYPGPNYLNYNEQEVIALNKVHRSKYKSDLSRMAVQGYDVMNYFCSSFFLNGKGPDLLMNTFDMHQGTQGSGFENTHTYIVEQENYDLINVTK